MMQMTVWIRRWLAVLGGIVTLALFLVACGGEDTPAPALPALPTVRASGSDEAASATATSALPVTPAEIQPSSMPGLPTQSQADELISISMPLMGTELHNPGDETVLALLSDSGAQLVRYNGVLWLDVEPQEGQYNWAALHELDSALQALAAREIEVILIIRGTPAWAQKVPGSACGPVREEKFGAFAAFVSELVRRYSAPPYNVRYWELGNEPDVNVGLLPGNSVFGCWGDASDPLYGGGYYAEMLKVVYPAIKAVDPDAQVLIGGLLLDCDPANPPEGKTCAAARFFDGILDNGGAAYFDIVSFHGYPFYAQQSFESDVTHPGWVARGGVIVGKINYLRDVMGLYGVDKPLFLTEGSLTCPEWNQADCLPPGDLFFEKQADYLVRMFVRNWALDVRGTIWYEFEGRGWRYGGLVGDDPENPKPAFQAFQFLQGKLAGMNYVGEIPLPEGVAGYAFRGNDRQTWVLWSLDESPLNVGLPPGFLAASDKYGQEIPTRDGQITISSPVYLDMAP